MTTPYRCYLLDQGGRIFERRDFEANSDTEAIARSRTLALEHKAHSFELWEATRYVHGERR
jgi:hypothetical protein